MHRHIALQVERQVISFLLLFAPTVFDDCAGFDSRHRKLDDIHFEFVGAIHFLVENRAQFQRHNLAIGFDRAPGHVFDLDAFEIGNLDGALLFAASVGENLEAQVMRNHGFVFALLHTHFPQQSFGIGVFFDGRRFQREVRGVNRLPLIAGAGGGKEQAEDKTNRGENSGNEFHTGTS